MVINNYVIQSNEDGYVCGFYATLEEEYDFIGQMAQYPEACEGWVKFIADQSETKGHFEIDEVKKQEILAQREQEELERERQASYVEAQTTYTALVTDTLLEV